MKAFYTIGVVVALGAAAAARPAQEPAMAQEQRAALERQMVAGGVRARVALEVRTTKDAPYTADAVTDLQQVLGDGNRITKRSVTRVFRDREGRTRRETTAIDAAGRETVSVALVDPVAGVSFVLDPDTRTAYKSAAVTARVLAPLTATESAKAALDKDVADRKRREAETTARVELDSTAIEMAGRLKAATERAVSGEGTTRTEDLGEKTIEGVRAKGTRTTTEIAAGAIGNEQPITIVSEQWFSPELQVLVMTRHSDPRVGETTYRLTNIVRADPDRSLFEVPADYTIKRAEERRVGFAIRRE